MLWIELSKNSNLLPFLKIFGELTDQQLKDIFGFEDFENIIEQKFKANSASKDEFQSLKKKILLERKSKELIHEEQNGANQSVSEEAEGEEEITMRGNSKASPFFSASYPS